MGETLWLDLRRALRSLAAEPGYFAALVLTFAVGLGANLAVFALVRSLLLRPLPYPEPDRLVRIESVRGGEEGQLSLREAQDLREQLAGVFSGVAVHSIGSAYNLSGDGPPEEVPSVLCSRNLFEVLGIELSAGGLWPEIYDRKRNYGVILTHEIWRRRWGGDPGLLGRTITMDAYPSYQVFGVLPPGVEYPVKTGLYRSLAWYDLPLEDRSVRNWAALGRLRPNVSWGRAQGELDALSARLAREYPGTNAEISLRLVPLARVFQGEIRPYLLMVEGAAILVLLIACANVAHLLLARAAGRARETAVSAALGAGRARLVSRRVAESLVAALLGGALGTALAYWGIAGLRTLVRAELPASMAVALDLPALALGFALTLLAGVGAGLLPAVQASRPRLDALLREAGRGSSGDASGRSSSGRLRRALVVAEVSVAALLLVGAGLLALSFHRLLQVETGLARRELLTFRVALSWRAYREDAQRESFYRRLIERLAALPGAAGAATHGNLPFSGDDGKASFSLEGQGEGDHRRNPYADVQGVSPGWFALAGVPIVAGRGPSPADRPGAPPVAWLSTRLARRLFEGESALGRRIKVGPVDSDWPWMTVVGVVGDVRHEALAKEPGFALYWLAPQIPDLNAFVVVAARPGVDPRTFAASAEAEVRRIDPDQSSYDFQTLDERIARGVWQRRAARTLFVGFAAIAALLAAIGIYGVLAHSVSQRRREIGIRMALGAHRGSVGWEVALSGFRLALIGLSLGLAAALALSQAFRAFLYGLAPLEPSIYLGVAVGLSGIALLASWLPARRAASLDPAESFRAE